MKKFNTLFYHILIFVLAQLAWFSLLGLWIYWYISNYIILRKVGDKLSPQVISESTNIFALVGGLVLLIVVSIGMSLIFIHLTRQMNLTKLYDNFIANVTHELKSPLSSIQLYLETLQSREVPRTNLINLMLNDVKRLNNLINSILYLSALEHKNFAKKMINDYHMYTADTVIRELINEAAAQFKLPENSVTIEGNAPCRCVIDRTWLKIVFDNLFDNAIKYSLDSPQIHVHLSCNKKNVVIEFSDQGVGIPIRDQQKIFNKFQRVNYPASPNVKGTGLGLYWVKEIIKYHNGKVSVFSKGWNKGTTFRIELPIYNNSKKRYIRNFLKRKKGSKI